MYTVGLTIYPHYHTIVITLTTVSLLSATINRSSVKVPDSLLPPNSAAFLSPTGVSVKLEHGGGGCPVMFGELHSPTGGGEFTYCLKNACAGESEPIGPVQPWPGVNRVIDHDS